MYKNGRNTRDRGLSILWTLVLLACTWTLVLLACTWTLVLLACTWTPVLLACTWTLVLLARTGTQLIVICWENLVLKLIDHVEGMFHLRVK